ncbi:hypothetical protein ACQI4L_14250 [Mycolicibacterium litorale]|uniref:hypothetical protein n=1 Tax=Mycolicibacterium litorale TaxID=758802 RepID=UPI003CF20300
MANVRTRVARVAETVLTERGAVRPVDILVGLGWLASPTVERMQVDDAKIVAVRKRCGTGQSSGFSRSVRAT